MDNQISELSPEVIESEINRALAEDIGGGDITTELLVSLSLNTKAVMKAKSPGVIAGLGVAGAVFKKLDSAVAWKPLVNDGDRVDEGAVIAEIEGRYKTILTGERTALNFLQRMSGIATETSNYVDAVRHTGAKILDSRKTVPGLRMFDKYSVHAGGGMNHRIGLFDMVLIKDNHIALAGGIKNAVTTIKSGAAGNIKIEVEVSGIEQAEEALEAGADVIMLDNMDNESMKKTVDLIGGRALTEASGNMSLERVKEVSETGVNFISVGALTHSVKAMDIALYISD